MLYMTLNIKDPDIVGRLGFEAFKLVYSMKGGYITKALKVLAHLEVSDKRTFRLLVRALQRELHLMSGTVAAETIVALAMVDIQPEELYHRTRGEKVYRLVTHVLTNHVNEVPSKLLCEVFSALARVRLPEQEMALATVTTVQEFPHKYHAEHVVSLLRDFAQLRYTSCDLRSVLVARRGELAECTPSAICVVPEVLATHPRAVTGTARPEAMARVEAEMLEDVSRMLREPGVYRLPDNAGAFRTKDDFWWKQLQLRNYRRRKLAKAASQGVVPAANTAEPKLVNALSLLSRPECVQLVSGMDKLNWRDEGLLEGVADWLCAGRHHAELEPAEVAMLLGAFRSLGFKTSLLRAAMEHALLRVVSSVSPADLTTALGGAMHLEMDARGAAVRSLFRRCTSELAMIPKGDVVVLQSLKETIMVTTAERFDSGSLTARLPLELHLFSEAMRSHATFAQ